MATDKLKVLMLQRVASVGKQGEIIEVSHSQAKNYLIPKGFARLITKQEEDNLAKKMEQTTKNTREIAFNRHKIAEALHSKEIIFEAKGGGGKMFGGLQELDIIEKINKEFGVKLEKKNIILPEGHHLKKAGKYDIKLNLGSDVYAKITIDLRVIQ